MEQNKKTPQIRFKGYTDAWEQRKLGEVAKYRNGKAHENCIDDNGKYIVVNSKFVSTDGEVKKYSNLQNEALFKNEIAFVLSDVPNGRAIARTFLVEKSDKYTLNQRIAGITPLSETYPYYLYILMNRHPYFLTFDDGAKQTNLSVSDVMGFESFYPKFEEQTQVGSYFRNLDNLINFQQRKFDKLVNVKKSMLDKMFPKDGETVPEIRFKGFTEDWEQCKLGDTIPVVTDYVAAGSFADIAANVDYKSEPDYAQLVRTVDLKHNFENNDSVYVDKNAFDYLYRVNLDEESIVLPNIGANIGEVYYIEPSELPYERNVLGPNAIYLKPNKNTKFIYSLFQTVDFQKKLAISVASSGQPKFNKTELKEIQLMLPNNDEQQRIGEYFFSIDNLITLHQRKLEKLKSIKKSCLEKMFI